MPVNPYSPPSAESAGADTQDWARTFAWVFWLAACWFLAVTCLAFGTGHMMIGVMLLVATTAHALAAWLATLSKTPHAMLTAALGLAFVIVALRTLV